MSRLIYRFFIITIIASFGIVSAFSKNASPREFIVVIDAGHGGKDIGAADNGVREKDINLKVAKNLESLIKKKMKNTRVVMTRDNDSYLTLQQRADKANKAQGDIFVSIHTNSVDKRNRNRKTVAGSSVYTLGLHKDESNLEVARRENSVIELEKNYEQSYSGFDPQRDESYIIFEMAQKKNLSQSINLANDIEKELVGSGRQDRGVHQAGFWVLWATSMPSVLVELDFICNPESAKYISSDKGAKELAEAIFNAIKKYEDSWRKSFNGLSGDNLTDMYVDGIESNLEDTFTEINREEVVTAKVRAHKTSDAKKVTKKKSGQRRRRSLASREMSLNNSYENGNVKVPVGSAIGSSNAVTENSVLLTDVSLQTVESSDKDNSKKKSGKKEKKKKEKKSESTKKTKQRKQDSHDAKMNKLVTVYKIQVLASADLLNQNNSRFCGLTPITTYKENNLYKYYYGESTNREEVESLLPAVRKKIPDAFIVTSQKTVQTK